MTEVRSGLPIIGFADQTEFEDWLAAQPADAAGVWIKLAKKGGGGGKSSLICRVGRKPSSSYSARPSSLVSSVTAWKPLRGCYESSDPVSSLPIGKLIPTTWIMK